MSRTGASLMEAVGPLHGALAPTASTVLEFNVASEALMRGCQSPAPGPEATESPPSEGVEGQGCSETPWGESRDASRSPAEIMPPNPEDSSEDKATRLETPETHQETLAAKHSTADSQARTLTALELWGHPVPWDSVDLVPIPSELGSRSEAELVAWVPGHPDELEDADRPVAPSPGPACGEHPVRTPQEGRGPVGCTHPQGVQEAPEAQVHGRRGQQGQENMQALWLGGPTPGQRDQGEGGWEPQGLRPGGCRLEGLLLGLEESGVDAELVGKPGGAPGKQADQALGGQPIPAEGWEEEAGDWAGDGLGASGEQAEHGGPPTPAPMAPGSPPPCDMSSKASGPVTGAPGPQVGPQAEDVSPLALTLGPEPEWSHLPMAALSLSPVEASPDDENSQEGQREGPGAWEDPSSVSGTPPQTLASGPSCPAQISPCPNASLPAGPMGEALLATWPPAASRASLSRDGPPQMSTTAPHGSPLTEDAWDLCPSPTGSPPHSPPTTPSGVTVHLRSNSFPGPHRTELPPELLARSLSFSHSEPPQRPPKPAIYGSVAPRRPRRSSRDGSSPLGSPAAGDTLGQVPESPTSPPWTCEHCSAPTPPLDSIDGRGEEPPPPLVKRHFRSPTGELDSCPRVTGPTPQRHSHPPTVALSSGPHRPPKGPQDPLVARKLRRLPSAPDAPHPAQTSLPPRPRYNKPLPPTPDQLQAPPPPSPPSRSLRTYKPLPPLPTMDPPSEPPPLPPKARARSRGSQGVLMNATGQARPGGQDWPAPPALSAGRTSWPPAASQSTDPLVSASRGRSDVAPGLAFTNVTNLLSPLSPSTAWPPEDGSWLPEKVGDPIQGPSKRAVPQEGASSPRGLSERPSHPLLEKASSWPHRRDPGRPPPGDSRLAPGEAHAKSKGWNRQGLRRPSILPEGEGAADRRGVAMEQCPGPSDTIVLREKKPKEATGSFSRRCSKLINSSQLLYQEYSDVFLNKEIQSQQRLDSAAVSPALASPRQPRKALASSESYLQRLSAASSGSLWQEIPVVRNSTVLLSMAHEDQKLQEAKFELIISEASYLRSLHVAVDHFQLSTSLRATLSNQEHQWLFSRLQDVRDVSTTFLSDLEENFENNIFTFHVCDVVLNHAPHFRRVYLPYVTNQTYQERTFQSLLNGNSHFREVLEKLESDPICQRLSLKSFLILPFQRITRLKLLLQNILKRTQPGSSEEAEATKAHHALEELIRDCNSNVQRMRRTEELIYLSQKIEFECKIFPLISQSRWLVKSGELTALEFSVSPGLRRKLNTRPVHLHLFNDCLLLSRPREGSRFLVFDHAPFSDVRGEKCEMKLHGAHKNLFRLFLIHSAQGGQAEFLFRTETQSEKLRWISALALPREELDLLECYDSPQVQCLRAYKPRENDELTLEKADVVMVMQQSNDGWLEGMRLSDGERGWFPLKHVEFIWNPEIRTRNLREAQRVKTARLQLVEQQA
ncbi:rho guanine nucleotide exchange factor 5 [Orycteropus afer afer]|uniref:Rho guanine nucleotide exchange factor 5 n=1 Tax=Orycteropus afer afer TaxID=1230840 RepID=A0A8B7B172_ORYAF|nr:rho guanine nucleotide exchange factor 5 [Orycteropus afer afer]